MADGGVYARTGGKWERVGSGGGSGGGIDVESERANQLLQGDGSAGWQPGMALEVVDAVPADDDAGYAIGDVVFVTGPGDGGSPGGGGGKVLQVVRATDSNQPSTTSTDYVDVPGMSISISPTSSSSSIVIVATGMVGAQSSTDTHNRMWAQITDENGAPISSVLGLLAGVENFVTTPTPATVTLPLNLWALDNPSTTAQVTYKMQFKVDASSTTAYFYNNFTLGQMYAIELADVVVSP